MVKTSVKKAQGMPLNVIIIAIILLVVLVIVIAIFTGNIGKVSKDLQSCGVRNGVCKENSCGSGEVKIEGVKCGKDSEVCCIRVLEQ